METLIEIIYFIFPLLFAGLIHHLIIIKYNIFSSVSKPIDGGLLFYGNPLLGKAKTWRGLIAVPLLSCFGSLIISQIISIPTLLNPALVGLFLGFGYALAELPNSFIKRRLTIPVSKKSNKCYAFFFQIFDQMDSVIGATIVMTLLYDANNILIFSVITIGTIFHFLVDTYLYKHGYKKI